MNTELSELQQQALDCANGVPARAADPISREMLVLLRSDDFDWIRKLLGDEPDAPRRKDPRTSLEYAVLPVERYERFKAFFEEDPLSPSERLGLLREAGRRAGWHGPEWENAGDVS